MCNAVGFGERDVYISVLCVRDFSAKLTKHTWRKLLCPKKDTKASAKVLRKPYIVVATKVCIVY